MVRVHPGPFLPGFQFFQKLKRSRDDDFFSSSSSSFVRRRRRGARRRVRVAAVAVVRSTTTEKHDGVSFSLNSLLNCVCCCVYQRSAKRESFDYSVVCSHKQLAVLRMKRHFYILSQIICTLKKENGFENSRGKRRRRRR